MRTIPQTPMGFQGLTSCCKADATFYGSTLVCRACGNAVTPIAITGERGESFDRVIRAWLDGHLTGKDIEFIQSVYITGNELLAPVVGHVISAEEIERAAKKD